MHKTHDTPSRLFLAGAAVLLAALGVGCGSDDGSDDGAKTSTTRPKPSNTDYLGAPMRARKKAHSTACKANLHALGSAIMLYRAQNADAFPTSLEQMIAAGVLDRGAAPTCPAQGAKPYVFIAPSAKNPPGSTVIVREATAVHGDHVNVLRADGSVGQLSLEQADREAPLPPAK